MRERFVDCDILDLSGATVNIFQSAMIQNGVDDAGAIIDTSNYVRNRKLDDIVENYRYDEDAEDVMDNGLEFI